MSESLSLEFYLVILGACLFTALLSAVLTGLGFYYYYRSRVASKLEEELDEYAEIVKQRLKEGVEEAGESLLPRFKQEVRAGFKEAISDAIAGGMVEDTVRSMTRTGTTIVESSLNLLLGKRETDTRPGHSAGPGVSAE